MAALEADLAEARIRPRHHAGAALAFQAEPEVWGALYAVEGSRLGNRVLLRRLAGRDENLAGRPTRFLAHGLEDAAAWPSFVTRLDALNYAGEAFESAVLGAAKVFDVYLLAAERNASPNHG